MTIIIFLVIRRVRFIDLNVFILDRFIGNLQVYPNPLIDGNELKIHGDLNQCKGLELFDSMGRLMFRSWNLSGGNLSVDMAGKGSGVFYLKLYADNQVHVEKIMRISGCLMFGGLGTYGNG